MIERCRDAFPVRMMCRCLRVSAGDYYDWRIREPSTCARANEQFLLQIRRYHTESDGVMGALRIRDELHYEGIRCGKNRVARLMRADGLQGVPQKRRWKKKSSSERPAGVQNHLERDFRAEVPNQKWTTDITYIETAEGWLYLCGV